MLQAHLGAQKAWHFQHHVEDANCNPQPMTLLHAFVRDEFALRRTIAVPAVTVMQELEVNGRLQACPVNVRPFELAVLSAKAEVRGDGVQPDVVCQLAHELTAALEVRYTHAVDEGKRQRLESGYSMALEFDVSDLPASGISREQLEVILQQPHRWTWLSGAMLRIGQNLAAFRVQWSQKHWRVGVDFSLDTDVRPASEKLRQVTRRMAWANVTLQTLKDRGVKANDGARWLGEQDKVDRVALACAALGIDPAQFPPFLQQFLPRSSKPMLALQHHPYSWQGPVFMKFCVGKREFSAHEAADWCLVALPDRCENEDGTKSLNGFTQTAAALFVYFMQLETQGLLCGVPSGSREGRRFRPLFESAGQLRTHLAGATDTA